ncbi:hypothetical protein [Candidatus Solirubrobacter pratensis]|uniref:hypothetical protein n=1 Tax=Candidatus Solirubrobacter pratensis TaxID=1298857 RepID=UPI0004129F9D|nr:hypothetical protein [Candidatus Solirubrobacter pratensis]
MCYDYLRRHRREADESASIWQDFERTRPIADPETPPDVTSPEPTEAHEETAVSER